MKKVIVGMGEILWDVFPSGKVLGGAPANFAYHVNQTGHKGSVISAIGEDDLGREILDHLSNKNLPHIIQHVDHPTGTVQVTLNKKGIPTYKITDKVAWDFIEFTPLVEELAQKTSAVCYGTLAQRNYVTRSTFFRFFKSMPAEGLKIYDINLRQNYYSKNIIEESLFIANILKINDEELEILSDLIRVSGDETERCQQIRDQFSLDMVILTKGTGGSHIITEKYNSFLDTPQVSVEDTVGAGDAFTAAFIASYLDGDTIETAHRHAVNVSAFVCTKKGAMPPYDYLNLTLNL
ncbi:MAG TPA: carbohydrate kinase [Bacteroidales bacterium]|jgi:fructokinase|nr:carbohydrate kinase [Bacteroidales bacterium]